VVLDNPRLSPILVRKYIKLADQVVNNSDVLVDDVDLQIPVEAYQVLLLYVMMIASSATATPDMDFAFLPPAGGTVRTLELFDINNMAIGTDMTAEKLLPLSANVTDWQHFLVRYIGGATAGVLKFQWAQNVATAEDTKLHANSFIVAVKIR